LTRRLYGIKGKHYPGRLRKLRILNICNQILTDFTDIASRAVNVKISVGIEPENEVLRRVLYASEASKISELKSAL
jgi:hypothetical protein